MPKGVKADADLDLFTAIEQGEVITQQALKRNVGVSVGLINALLKRAMGKGLVKVREAPYKRYAYYLTPQGFLEKSRLVATYLESSLKLFREARDQYAEIFRNIHSGAAPRVILAGRGELAEIALMSAREAGIEVHEIYDREANTEQLYGLKVRHSLHDIDRSVVLVVTASRRPQDMFDHLREQFAEAQIHAPHCLRIVRTPPSPRTAKPATKGARR